MEGDENPDEEDEISKPANENPYAFFFLKYKEVVQKKIIRAWQQL